MPRHKGDFESADWQHVKRETSTSRRNPTVTCEYCGDNWCSNSLQRLHAHLEKCQHLPQGLWKRFRSHRLGDSQDSGTIERKKARLHDDSIELDEQYDAESALASWIFAAGLPLDAADHPAFRSFVNQLRPAFSVPGQSQLIASLLLKEYDRVYHENQMQLANAKHVTIVTSHASDVQGCDVFNHFAVTRDAKYFVKSLRFTAGSQTDRLENTGLLGVINDVGPSRIVSICTNSTYKLRAAVNEVQASYPKIVSIDCCLRQIDQMVADILVIDEVYAVLVEILNVASYFKKQIPEAAAQLTAKRLGLTYCSIADLQYSDWQSKLRSAESVVVNQATFQSAVMDERLLPSKLNTEDWADFEKAKAIVTLTSFWVKARELITLLVPFSKITMSLSTSNPSLSDVYSGYCQLLTGSVTTNLVDASKLKELISKSLKQIYHPLMCVAYLADPHKLNERRERPDTVTDSQLQGVGHWLVGWYRRDKCKVGTTWGKLQKLRACQAPFVSGLKIAAAQSMTAVEWWQACWLEEERDLAELCVLALSIVPLANVGDHGFVYADLRGRLSDDLVDKLIYVYANAQIRGSARRHKDDHVPLLEGHA